jgi:beta-mannosidase
VSRLHDGWTLREALGRTWQWYVVAPLPEAGNNVADAAERAASAPGWHPARVPGSVVGALVRAGEAADPYVGRQSRLVEWTADRHWVFRRRLEAPAMGPDERAVLELDGIDPGGRVFVDGTEVGRATGLFHPFRADVTPLLRRPGPHRLAVVVDPVPDSEPQVGRTDRVRVHAPRLNYGWDFSPRLPHQGIWRPVRLVVGRLHLHDVVVATEIVEDDVRVGLVHIDAMLEGLPADADTLVCTVADPDGTTVAEKRMSVLVGQVGCTVEVPDPALWWPRGHGGQPLYTVALRHPGVPSASWSGRTGFRAARMRTNPVAPADALPYSAEVNGVPIPLVGWNWAPVDTLHGDVTPERVRHLVGLAAESGARLIRVWGGGLLETSEFYQACDEAGLLVWQEFSQSSSGFQSAPATDDEFVALMRAEAEVVVPPRRRHPSLLMWGGGNELDVAGAPADESSSPVLAALREAVHRLDPGRHWVPSSPSGIGADEHGPWEHQGLGDHYAHWDGRTSLAHTEFGVEGMANARAFEAVVPEEDRWPLDRTNPVMRHLGEWWDNEPLVQESFAHRLTDVAAVRRGSQLLQATGLRYAVEALRRRSPRCSMVLPWQLAESYPNAWCTAVVDHLGEPKPAYRAVTRAFADDRVTLRVDRGAWPSGTPSADLWLWSVRGVAAGSALRLLLVDADGKPVDGWDWTDLPAVSEPWQGATASAGATQVDAVLFWDALWTDRDGAVLDRTVELLSTGPDWSAVLDLERASVATTVRRAGSGRAVVEVEHLAGPAVVGLTLADARPAHAAGLVAVHGDADPLLPGESRTFSAAWTGDPPRLRLEAFNVEPALLDLGQE